MITHVLDTSAILAHYLGENGADQISSLIEAESTLGISVVSIIELRTRLEQLCEEPAEVARAFNLYTKEVASAIDADGRVAAVAIELRKASGARLPLIDSIIAATAKAVGATLVHRDPHFLGIPQSELKQQLLPEK